MSIIESFVALQITAFMLTFVRLGTAVMLMPGVGDSFVPTNIRLYFALALSLVLMPIVAMYMPAPVPTGTLLIATIFTEFMIGALIGTIARILMSATDTAGMILSFQTGLSNAQLFNPQMAMQGSLLGAFLSVSAACILFTLDIHHLMIRGLLESYTLFPMGQMPDSGSMAEVVVRTVLHAFDIAVQMSAPLLITILILYVSMGVLSKLMPQLQIFMIAMPVQIMLSLLILILSFSAMMTYFTNEYGTSIGQFLGGR